MYSRNGKTLRIFFFTFRAGDSRHPFSRTPGHFKGHVTRVKRRVTSVEVTLYSRVGMYKLLAGEQEGGTIFFPCLDTLKRFADGRAPSPIRTWLSLEHSESAARCLFATAHTEDYIFEFPPPTPPERARNNIISHMYVCTGSVRTIYIHSRADVFHFRKKKNKIKVFRQ